MARYLVFDTQAVNTSINTYGEYHVGQSVWGTAGIGPTGANLRPITPWRDQSAYVATPLLVPVPTSGYRTTPYGAFYGHSWPVRLFGAPDGSVQEMGWEFYLYNTASGPLDDIQIGWYQEFFNERNLPYLEGNPIVHRSSMFDQLRPWVREQVESVDATGLITHDNIVRVVTMHSNDHGDSRYFPMKVHAGMVRLTVFVLTNIALPADYLIDCAVNPSPYHLQIWAVAGGVDQCPAMHYTEKRNRVWDWTAVAGPRNWTASAPGDPNTPYNGTWPTS